MKKYLIIGIPIWILSTVVTKSLFIYPTIFNGLGFFAFQRYSNKNKNNS
jgi:hypothetical protein